MKIFDNGKTYWVWIDFVGWYEMNQHADQPNGLCQFAGSRFADVDISACEELRKPYRPMGIIRQAGRIMRHYRKDHPLPLLPKGAPHHV